MENINIYQALQYVVDNEGSKATRRAWEDGQYIFSDGTTVCRKFNSGLTVPFNILSNYFAFDDWCIIEEKKRVPLTVEDLDKRAIEGKPLIIGYMDDDCRVIICSYDSDTIYFMENGVELKVGYQHLSENYMFVDGTPCWKEL